MSISIDWKAIAKELGLVLIVVAAAELALAFDQVAADPSVILADPKAFIIGLGARLAPKLLTAALVKGREILARLFGLGA